MDNEKKIFLKGITAGIIGVFVSFFIFGNMSIIYHNVLKKEMTYNQKQHTIQKYIDRYYAGEYDKKDIYEGIYAGLVAGLNDKYSVYMGKETFNEYKQNTEGSYKGIGIITVYNQKTNVCEIGKVFDESPAEQAGLLSGDIIIKVDGKEITGYEDYVERIKEIKSGKESVVLDIERNGEKKSISINISEVDIPTVSSKMIDGTTGYIYISSFDGVTVKQFENAFNRLENEGMKELVLDLRDNPGGLMDTVTKIADKFLDEGTITYTEDKNGNREYEYSDSSCTDIPLAVLVNGGSASASEVFSAAVKDRKRAKLIGTKTYGKGVVQSLFPLGDGSGVKLTIAKYYTPDGICIDGIGIEPDYVVELPDGIDYTNLNDENDTQLKKAVEVVKNLKS